MMNLLPDKVGTSHTHTLLIVLVFAFFAGEVSADDAESYETFLPRWKVGDWWIVQQTGWKIPIAWKVAAKKHKSSHKLGWFKKHADHWLGIVTELKKNRAIIAIHEGAENDEGKVVYNLSEPHHRFTVALDTFKVIDVESKADRFDPREILLPSGQNGLRDYSRESYRLFEHHRIVEKNGKEYDSVVFVHEDQHDFLKHRDDWGLDWSWDKLPRGLKFEERQEWHKGDNWWRRMARWKESGNVGGLSWAYEEAEEEHRIHKDFWKKFRKTGWPEDKPQVKSKLIDQGNINERKPPHVDPKSQQKK